jgi:hypothetical protein
MYFLLNLAIMMCSEAINESKRSNGSIVGVKASCKYLPGKIGRQNLLLYFAYITFFYQKRHTDISYLCRKCNFRDRTVSCVRYLVSEFPYEACYNVNNRIRQRMGICLSMSINLQQIRKKKNLTFYNVIAIPTLLKENKLLIRSTVYFSLWHCGPTRARTSSFTRFLDHSQRRNTVGRTPLDE